MATTTDLSRVFITFVIVLIAIAVLNIFSGHLMAIMNNVSVWWHVAGAAIVILILVFLPDQHQSFSYVFGERFNNSGYSGGDNGNITYWFLIVPFGLLLTQYTITGFDASAHLSEETQAASEGAAKGIWQSIFYSAIGGWILLCAFLFAVPDDAAGNPDNAGVGGGGVAYIFTQALDKEWAVAILAISAIGQFFCSTSCMTSASRMTFAFSRDGAIPASHLWSKVSAAKVPANAVMLVAVAAGLITLPALVEVNIGTPDEPDHRSDGVLRGRLRGGHRPVPGVPRADLAALADGRRVRAGLVDERREVQVDELGRGHRDRDHLDLLHPSVRAAGSAVERRLLVEVRQLRTDS